VIVWGCVTGYLTERKDILVASLDRVLGGDDVVVLARTGSIAVGYNRILDLTPKGAPVVLFHDDTEFGAGARLVIADAMRDIDVVGAIGGVGVTEMAWWNAPQRRGWVQVKDGRHDFGPHGPVDAVDGLLMALAPSATHLRFDESYPGFHGYDVDLCFQARAEGLVVATADIPVTHRTKGGIRDQADWDACEEVWRKKWT
jgi:hypothetical protein